jgi:hypothetical protein
MWRGIIVLRQPNSLPAGKFFAIVPSSHWNNTISHFASGRAQGIIARLAGNFTRSAGNFFVEEVIRS